jgi:hypothetical protein
VIDVAAEAAVAVLSDQSRLVSSGAQIAQTQPPLRHDCLPFRQGGGASLLVDFPADEVALLAEWL